MKRCFSHQPIIIDKPLCFSPVLHLILYLITSSRQYSHGRAGARMSYKISIVLVGSWVLLRVLEYITSTIELPITAHLNSLCKARENSPKGWPIWPMYSAPSVALEQIALCKSLQPPFSNRDSRASKEIRFVK